MAVKVVTFLTVCFLAAAYCNFIFYEDIHVDDGDSGPLSNLCLGCMCEVLGCRHEETCTNACGPFQITYGYWQHAFDRPANELEEFRKCTLNAWCAKRTVQMYMKKNLLKCMRTTSERINNTVTACETAMTLHRYGSAKCNGSEGISPAYREQLVSCLDRRTWATLVSDRLKAGN